MLDKGAVQLISTTEQVVPARKALIGFNEGTLALVGAAVLLIGAVFWADRGALTEKTDFSVTYLGARMIHDGQGAKLYDLVEQERMRTSLFEHPNPLIYEHPPFEAFLFAPLSSLPYRTAYLIWGLGNALIWLVLPYLVRPYAPVPKDALGYLALWFLFAPLGVALFQGQTSLALLMLYTLTFINLKSGHELRGGLCLGLGLFKFQFVIPFALIFLFRQKWRFLGGFLVSAGILGVLSLIAVGWHGMLSYIHLLLQIGNNPDNLSYGSAIDMPTVQGFVYAILGQKVGPWTVKLIVAALSMFLVLFVAWYWRREDIQTGNVSFDLMFAGAIAVSLLTGFHMFTHDFSPLILAMFLVAAHLHARGSIALRTALWITLILFWLPPIYFAFVSWHTLYLMCPVLLVFALSALRLARSAQGMQMEGGI
jgi:hypothetical protein